MRFFLLALSDRTPLRLGAGWFLLYDPDAEQMLGAHGEEVQALRFAVAHATLS